MLYMRGSRKFCQGGFKFDKFFVGFFWMMRGEIPLRNHIFCDFSGWVGCPNPWPPSGSGHVIVFEIYIVYIYLHIVFFF